MQATWAPAPETAVREACARPGRCQRAGLGDPGPGGEDLADAGRLPVWPGDPPVVEGDEGVQGGGPTRGSPSHGLLGESQDTASTGSALEYKLFCMLKRLSYTFKGMVHLKKKFCFKMSEMPI